MRGVGPGTVLGGRYTMRERLAQDRGTERWSAADTTLSRGVSILVVPADDHRAAGLLDAARRAGSVAHAVLVRVLDVGEDDEVAYVVEEELAEARTLAELVTDGGIPGDEVRRITGEVAAALESARQRGMHHLDLTPADVVRTPDGEVRVRGLEIAAVRAGIDALDPDEAARRDAVGVVALAYAGLTGRWPLENASGGLPAASRVPGGVVAPAETAAGVPRDLDALCRLTLNGDEGPTSPGDYARQVAPWPSRQVLGRPAATARPASAPEGTAELPRAAAASPAVTGTPDTVAEDTDLEDTDADDAEEVGQDDVPAAPPPWLLGEDLEETEEYRPVAPRAREEATSGPAGGATAAGGAALAGAAARVGGRAGTLARRAVDKVTELSPDTRPGDPDGPDGTSAAVPAEPLSHDESKLALGIVIAFLIVALVIGIIGVSRIGSHSDLGLTDSTTSTATTTASSPSASEESSTQEGSSEPEPLAILKVEPYDPQGDNAENSSIAPKTYDGDTSTGWYSENYLTDEFGGLKQGVGLIVDLGPNKKPQDVRLDIPKNVDLEVYVGPDASLEGARKIGSKKNVKGELDFPVPQKVSGQYIVVWYTGLHPDEDGKRRAWLNEVVVTG
ncbi:hypothetical protein H9L10_13570 [Phycicoccus endophyticus]|uniref:Protein kinase domain-containing protein n=1 Tax=Phycicoccus endophyticus TaxID=1690220 RepID=A0A7G9R0W0_9MICO|nr:protein kinase family protein [Phycicoccus endophyticus]NHI19526.1 hypothetical protein [Phycicoccus endophyticus]QNN49235.1 hypothetical protein H9L10_13570 [Phycicoccus endophyticus]GGL39903.1 hypothetical protein GCM10012283_22970 [Phycicoccus endophyticus]